MDRSAVVVRLLSCMIGILSCLSGAGCRTRSPAPHAAPVRPVPDEVARHIPDYRHRDTRPYELIWSRRTPRHDHLLDFERLLGWQAEADDGAWARIERCQDYQLWGDYVGLLHYAGLQPVGRVRLKPPAPILVADPVDTLTLWVHAGEFGGPDLSRSRLLCVLRDARAIEHRVDLGPVLQGGWRLLYAKLPDSLRLVSAYPLEVLHFEWSNLPATPHAELRLDALALFMDGLEPIRFNPRPQRPLPLVQGQLLGVNTGPGYLPFPTTPETILPPLARSGIQSGVRFEIGADEQIELWDEGHAEPIRFRLDVANGLQAIDILWNGRETGISVGGITVAGGITAPGRPIVLRRDRDRIYLEYAGGLTYRIGVQGASLTIDLEFRGRQMTDAFIGPLLVTGRFVPLRIPYLHRVEDAVPPVLLVLDQNPPLFAHMMLDVYRSNASLHELQTSGGAEQTEWRLGATYLPRSDQIRNDAHERFVLSVSPQLMNVLPVIPNPMGRQAEGLRERMLQFADASGEPYLPLAHVDDLRYRAIAEHLLVLTSERIWREEEESRSFRLRTNPHLGGTAVVREWFRRAGQSGAMSALYLNVRELSPLNEFWSSDHLLRSAEHRWQAVDGFSFSPKPLFALQWILRHAAELHQQVVPHAYWLDAFAARPPWSQNDYDRRIPGAATLSQSLFADGDLLLTLSSETGVPLIGEALAARFYAGLLDGLVTMDVSVPSRPYDPVFKLNRIHPLSVVFAPPFPADLFHAEAGVQEGLDRYLADQIAYGNAGRLPDPGVDVKPEHLEQIVYSLLALQRRYLLRRPQRILFATETGYEPLAAAIQNGAWSRSFLYVEYPDDLEIWVNGSQSETWSVRVGSVLHELPPSGWLAKGPDLVALSANVEGDRIDYVESPEYLYLNPRGRAMQYRMLASDGEPVLVLLEPDLIADDEL